MGTTSHGKFARFPSAQRLLLADTLDRCRAAGLPRQDHVYITADESFSFHNNKLNEIPCKLDSTEDLRLFEKYSRWGWVFLERTQILSGIQLTRHFIEFVVVETKKFVSSKVNVILTRQACGQCSCMSSGSKHRALEIYFDKRICHMFTLSKC